MSRNTFPRAVFSFVLVSLVVLLGRPCVAQQNEEITINIKGMENVDARGNAHVQWVMSFTPARGYDRVKRIYPNLYVLFRDLGPERSGNEINRSTLKITPDDGQRTITVDAEVSGAAVARKNRWQIQADPSEQISNQDGNRVFTVAQADPKNGVRLTLINTYILPAGAQGAQLGSDHLLTYSLAVPKALPTAAQPKVDVSIRHKKRLMAAVYKVYGETEAGDGAYWVAKTTFKNIGKAPIYNLRITYRLGDYTDTSVPDAYSWVAPGGVVVDRYYPLIRNKVAELKTETPVELKVNYEYADSAGKPYSGELSERLSILGVNQFEFSNLDDEDRTDNWKDYFNNAPLLAAFVTKMDDPVRQFAGYASHRSGMTAPASRAEDAVKWLQAAYETELYNDIVYTTPSGSFLAADSSSVQDIKYPRDVFRDKTGTCIDLAITYAALAESVGLHASLMVVPGHTFAVIRLPNGQYLPVENTGLGGGNQRAGFEQVVQLGQKEFNDYLQDGRFYFVDVQKEWDTDRVPTPELPQLATDFLEKSGIRPWNERGSGGSASAGSGGGGKSRNHGQTLANIPGTAYRVVHDHGMGMLQSWCAGTLIVSSDQIVFQADKATDGRFDRFVIKKSDIKEAKKNRMPLGQNTIHLEGFHIRLTNGVNYNFANIDQNGRGLSADPILMEIMEPN